MPIMSQENEFLLSSLVGLEELDCRKLVNSCVIQINHLNSFFGWLINERPSILIWLQEDRLVHRA